MSVTSAAAVLVAGVVAEVAREKATVVAAAVDALTAVAASAVHSRSGTSSIH